MNFIYRFIIEIKPFESSKSEGKMFNYMVHEGIICLMDYAAIKIL
jgi:hypothetical protein